MMKVLLIKILSIGRSIFKYNTDRLSQAYVHTHARLSSYTTTVRVISDEREREERVRESFAVEIWKCMEDARCA